MSTQGSIFAWIRRGFGAALGHKRLVLAFYLVPLLPALLWAWVAAGHLKDRLADRPFAQELLGGNAFGVLQDFLNSPDNQLGILFSAFPLLLGLSLLLHIALAAGAAPVLLGKDSGFFTGIGRYFGRYLRSLIAFAATLAPGFVLIAVASGVGGRLAENAYDERFQYGATVVGLLLFLFWLIPADLAYDLSRLAAAEHDGRRTLRGYYRALWAVVRRPLKLIPFYLAFLLILAVVLWLIAQIRGGLTITSTGTLLAMLLVQQIGMLFRAFWQVSFWGAEVALYRDLDSPDWCGAPKRVPAPAVQPTTEPREAYALPGEPAEPAELQPTPPPAQPEGLSSVAPKAPEATEPIRPLSDEEVEAGEKGRE